MRAWGRHRRTAQVGRKPGSQGPAVEQDVAGGRRTADPTTAHPTTAHPTTADRAAGRTAADDDEARRATGPADGRSLSTAVDAAHSDAARLVEISLADASREALPTIADPRQRLRASDAAVAAVCAHLCTMDTVVYPEISRRVPDSRRRLAALRKQAREAFSIMRGIEQYVQGDTNLPAESVGDLRRDLAELLAAHARDEDALLRDLAARISEADGRGLTERFEQAMRHAPTRPHPHLVRRAPFGGRLAMRLAGHWDHVLDTMDARAVAGAPVRAPAPSGLWGWYLLGRPTADAADETAGPAGSGRIVSAGSGGTAGSGPTGRPGAPAVGKRSS